MGGSSLNYSKLRSFASARHAVLQIKDSTTGGRLAGF